MDPLIIEPTNYTPKIVLDAQNAIFEITERSLPEDALAFYLPVVNWLEEYSKEPNPHTVFKFQLDYFNTASSRMLFKIFSILSEIDQDHKVSLKWYYRMEDADMLASGERFAKLVASDMEMVEY